MKKLIYTLMAGILLLCSNLSITQEKTVSIQLLDQSTKLPIVNANFQYNKHFGVSDNQGKIHFQVVENDTIFLSHVGYGEWYLTGVQLNSAIEKGTSYRAERTIRLQPVTVISMHTRGTVEPMSLDVHDKLSHDAGAILTQTAAVNSIRKSGGYGFDPVLRGFKYDQVNLVINGAMVASAACPNRMDPPSSQISPNMIQRVEILKGPHSFRYGTAFGGTINFESTPPQFSEQQKVYGRLSGGSESNGGVYRSEGVVGVQNKSYDLGLFGSFSKGDDYQDGDELDVAANFQRASFGANLGLRLSDTQLLSFSATHNKAKDTDFAALPMDLRSDKTWLLNTKHEINFANKHLKSLNTAIYATFVKHLMDNFDKNLNPRMVNADTDADTRSYGGRSESVWSFDHGKMYAGLDLRVERADGERTREFLMGAMAGNTVFDNVWNGGQVSKTGVFAEYHFTFPAFRLIASGRLEYNNAKATDTNPGFLSKNPDVDESQINPNISIGGFKDFTNGLSLGLWLGHAQRSGSIAERYINSFPIGIDPYDMLGNPQLDPEVNNQIDFTLGYKTTSTNLTVGVYASFLEDYISSEIDATLSPTMPSSPGVRRFVNIQDAAMRGFEITWTQNLRAGLKCNLNMAYTHGRDEVRNEPLPEIAPLDFRLTLSGGYLENKLRPIITFRHVVKQDRISSAFGETTTPAFSLFDLGLTYQLKRNLGATLGIKNLLDEAYYEHLNRAVRGQQRAIFSPGRNVYLTLFMDLM